MASFFEIGGGGTVYEGKTTLDSPGLEESGESLSVLDNVNEALRLCCCCCLVCLCDMVVLRMTY
jgi:hypothetical protein